MKEKNKKLILIVGALLLTIGISLAYYASSIFTNGEGSSVNVTTATINGAELSVEGTINFNDANFYPGHKMVSAIKVTATGSNELIPYNLIWNGTNGLSKLNFTVYKTSSELDIRATCNKQEKTVSGGKQYSETCSISNMDSLGEAISSGSINKNDTKVTLKEDEFITATSDGDIKYYYIILEYPNLSVDQSADMGASITGEVTVEKSDVKPDINIMAVYVKQDNGEYAEQNEIPEGYQVNTEKSTCSNGAVPSGTTPNIMVNGLSTTGTSCYLYLDKQLTGSEEILANVTVKNGTPDFSTIATGAETVANNGVYKTSDPMYGENAESYYWRGAATNNYLRFGDYCWRIIRINGDGSIRIIYDGASCHANGKQTSMSIVKVNQAYNANYSNSLYVGWTYTIGSQRTLSGTDSNAKMQLENWYSNDSEFTNYQTDKIENGKFCNDRNVDAPPASWNWSEGNYTTIWMEKGKSLAYAGAKRLYEVYNPTLSCDTGDIYITKVGLITADEVEFAGGMDADNTQYYLYNGQSYWTMSARNWNGSNAFTFLVNSNGNLNGDYVNNPNGIRPVINLKSDVTISSGTGTQTDPFIVE